MEHGVPQNGGPAPAQPSPQPSPTRGQPLSLPLKPHPATQSHPISPSLRQRPASSLSALFPYVCPAPHAPPHTHENKERKKTGEAPSILKSPMCLEQTACTSSDFARSTPLLCCSTIVRMNAPAFTHHVCALQQTCLALVQSVCQAKMQTPTMTLTITTSVIQPCWRSTSRWTLR